MRHRGTPRAGVSLWGQMVPLSADGEIVSTSQAVVWVWEPVPSGPALPAGTFSATQQTPVTAWVLWVLMRAEVWGRTSLGVPCARSRDGTGSQERSAPCCPETRPRAAQQRLLLGTWGPRAACTVADYHRDKTTSCFLWRWGRGCPDTFVSLALVCGYHHGSPL